jgi:hypothetical protein
VNSREPCTGVGMAPEACVAEKEAGRGSVTIFPSSARPFDVGVSATACAVGTEYAEVPDMHRGRCTQTFVSAWKREVWSVKRKGGREKISTRDHMISKLMICTHFFLGVVN